MVKMMKLFKIIQIWNKISLYFRLHFYRSMGVKIGKNVFVSPKAYIDITKPNMITIGDNCMITRNCIILSHSAEKERIFDGKIGGRRYGKVKIGNNVFLGVNTVVMPDVNIGDNVIVGATSLVNEDIPPNCVAYGVPAKRVKGLKNEV